MVSIFPGFQRICGNFRRYVVQRIESMGESWYLWRWFKKYVIFSEPQHPLIAIECSLLFLQGRIIGTKESYTNLKRNWKTEHQSWWNPHRAVRKKRAVQEKRLAREKRAVREGRIVQKKRAVRKRSAVYRCPRKILKSKRRRKVI